MQGRVLRCRCAACLCAAREDDEHLFHLKGLPLSLKDMRAAPHPRAA